MQAAETFQRFARTLTRYWRGDKPVPAPKPLLESIERFYELRDREEMTEFLTEHQDLIPVLIEAATKIRRNDFFPMDKLSLEFFVDPENDKENAAAVSRAVIVISTLLSAEEAFDRHKHLQSIWWLDVFIKYGDRLSLIIEFV